MPVFGGVLVIEGALGLIEAAPEVSVQVWVLCAVPSVAVFLFTDVVVSPPLTIGAVNLGAFALVITMTFITAPYGAILAHRMNARPLKRAFGVFLTLVALNMLRKVLGL